MKHIQSFVFTAVCTAFLALTGNASAQDTTQGVVTVVRIQGVARYSSDGNVWHNLTPGQTIGAGDVIQTGANSTADLILSDKAAQVTLRSNSGQLIGGAVNIAGLPQYNVGRPQSAPEQNVLRLQADTVLAVDKFIYSQTGADTVTDTELDLRAGKIFGNVKKISAASKFLVKMPTGVAGIRGTAFVIGAEGEVTVLEGSVVISSVGINGTIVTTVLAAGDQFNPQTGQVTRITNTAQFINALLTAKTLVIAVNEAVTIVETPTPNGPDTTTINVSPTSGNSGLLIL